MRLARHTWLGRRGTYNVEFLLDGHHNLDAVQAVKAKLGEGSTRGNLQKSELHRNERV